MTNLEQQYRTAVSALEAAQRACGAIPRTDIEARARAREALAEAEARVRDARDEMKQNAQRHTFAGIGSPVHAALATRVPPDVLAAAEAEALAVVVGRERAKAAKVAATPPPAPPVAPRAEPRRRAPEVFIMSNSRRSVQ